MKIGVVKESKVLEGRVALIPAACGELVQLGHEVYLQRGAGELSGYSDADYQAQGVILCDDAQALYAAATLIVKVKEPIAGDLACLGPQHILFCYLHLAASPELTDKLCGIGLTAIAFETVTDAAGGLPLLKPMSEIAGRMSVLVGGFYLARHNGGKGILLGGVPGVAPAKVVVIGGGVVGENAIMMALGMGANVTVLDRNVDVLGRLAGRFGSSLKTVYSTRASLEEYVLDADLVVGAVLVVGAEAPKLVTADMVRRMKPGSVLTDVAIDQGGCFETSRPTTHADPIYVVDNVVHYCVANMPGATPTTSTYALNNVTLPYGLALADKGYKAALLDNPNFREGLNVCKGRITHKAVAEDLGYAYVDPVSALEG